MTKNILEFKAVLQNEREFSKFSKKFQLFCKNNTMDDQKRFDLEVCLEEIVSNSFSHGNPKDPVTIFVCIQNNEIKVSIHDMAPPFHLLKKALTTSDDKRADARTRRLWSSPCQKPN